MNEEQPTGGQLAQLQSVDIQREQEPVVDEQQQADASGLELEELEGGTHQSSGSDMEEPVLR